MVPSPSTLFIGFFIGYIAWRIFVLLVIYLAKRFAKLSVNIQGVGIFALSNVNVLYKEKHVISVEVEKLWLSSCYLNRNTRRVIGVCASGVRLHVDLPKLSTDQNEQRRLGSATNIRNIVGTLRYLINWSSIQADNICVTVRGGVLNNCILHVTIEDLVPELTVQNDRISFFWSIEGCTTKLLCPDVQYEPHAPCLGQLQFSHLLHITATLGHGTAPHVTVTELSTELKNPQIVLQKALFHTLLLFRPSPDRAEVTTMNRHNGQSQVHRFIPLHRIPQKIDVLVSDISLSICDKDTISELAVSLTLLQCSSTSTQQGDYLTGQLKLHLKDLFAKSTLFTFCGLHMMEFLVQANEETVEVNLQILNNHFGYHHDEFLHWFNVVQPNWLPSDELSAEQNTTSSMEKIEKSPVILPDLLLERSLTISCTVKHQTAALVTTACSGIKLGLAEFKLSWMLHNREHKFDVEMTSGYMKLSEGSVHSVELAPQYHHHNTLLYIGLVLAKLNSCTNMVSADILVDSLQAELSTKGLRVCQSLAEHIVPATPSPHLDKYANVGKKNQVKTRLLAQEFNIITHATNITVFASYEDKASTVIRMDETIVCFKQSGFKLTSKLIKMAYHNTIAKIFPIVQASEMQECVVLMRQLSITVDINQKKVMVSASQEFSIVWSMALHLCLLEVFREFYHFKQVMKPNKLCEPEAHVNESPALWNVSVDLCPSSIQLSLDKNHHVAFCFPGCAFKRHQNVTSLTSDLLTIEFDGHEIFNITKFHAISDHQHDSQIERLSFKQLEQESNRTWQISFEKFSLKFPYGYNFAACLEQVKNANKWRKLVHHVVKKSFTAESRLPPDLIIRIKFIQIQINDDPFEVRLGDNYKLMCDEHMEHNKRVQTLDQRIQDLRKKHGLLPASKVEELYNSLESSRGDHYIRRSLAMCDSGPARMSLWRWTLENLEIAALADSSLHGTDNVVSHMRQIDTDSPYTDGLEFVTLWCRMVNVSVDSFVIGFRDYPLPLINIEGLHVWGRLVGAEQKGEPHARRLCVIEQGDHWGRVTIERNMPPLKYYHDFSCDVKVFNIAYGGCWEPAMAQFNLSMNLINQPSADPSRPLPIWDKLRLLLHGRLTMSTDKMSWIYPASLDPYNKTEMMDWTWSNLILDWTNAKWVLRGDLDIYARTASKYDDCRLLHLPNLRFSIRLNWITVGDANDHHAVMPCAPDKRTPIQEQDSYANFRSQGLNKTISFVTTPTDVDLPSCLFYASTLRWMDKIKMCMAKVSRPIRRGKYFKYSVARKPQYTRHIRELNFVVDLHGIEIDYWGSFARQIGLRAKGGQVSTDIGLQLGLVHVEDGLSHRAQSQWSVKRFTGHVKDFTIWLCTAKQDKGKNQTVNLQGPVSRSYLISVDRVSYERADETLVVDGESEFAVHHLQAHNLRGAWTPSNRDVALAMYDAYVKSQRTKKNLSSEALHGFRVDTHCSGKLNKSLNTSGAKVLHLLSSPPPLPNQNDPGFSMLQQLVAESDTKFVAASEEMPEPELLVKQLHGIAVCDTDDVTRKKWHVELYKSQVVLRGVETSGYVIVSAAKASLLACDHKPIWQGKQLKSKSTLVGSVESMQYYATVRSEDDVVLWLSEDNIAEQKDTISPSGLEGVIGLADMMGSGHSVGGVVTDGLTMSGSNSQPAVQLQRIVSRCHCEFFYADYGEVEDKTLPEVPLPPSDSRMLQQQEGVDCFTLLHHDLNICTNSMQYDMILDIINNLLLYVEPKKKELTNKLENMRFSLQLSSIEDQKTPILQRQNTLRELFLETRRLERQLYSLHRDSKEDSKTEDFLCQSDELHRQLGECKDQINSLSEELAIMVSCFKESQLQIQSRLKVGTATREAPALRLYEVCFKHAEWRMTEDDGQIGIADLVLKNFLYKKTNCEDESGAHQLDLGWVKVTNLLPGTPYREVLVPCDPQGKILSDRLPCLRILCRFKVPVGGISVKEHFEVNVAPLTIQLTSRFYRTVMSYFFREKQDEHEDDIEEIPAELMENHPVVPVQVTAGKGRKKDESLRKNRNSSKEIIADIDKMKERAAKNNMFLYIKIPEVPLRISYKGDKEKNITNIHDFQFLLPTLEYHDQTWTWHDLALVLKNDSKKRLISQAVQQKLHMKFNFFDFGEEEIHEDADKARLLMGTKLLGPSDKKTGKKSFLSIKKS